jgi:acyl carrier protein
MSIEWKNKILEYIKKEYIINHHLASCMFPEEPCTCNYNIDFNTPLVRKGYLDSFDLAEIAVFCEELIGKTIPDKDITVQNFESINQLEKYIDNL